MNRALLRRAAAETGSRLTEIVAAHSNGHKRISDDEEVGVGRELIRNWLLAHREECMGKGEPRLTIIEEEKLGRALFDRLFGLGGLQPHLDDPDVDNIYVNGFDVVWIEYAGGRRLRGEPVADSDEDLVELVRRIAARQGLSEREFSVASPILNVTLRDGSRLTAVMSVTERPSVTIRRHRLLDVSLDDLVEPYRLLSSSIRDLLAAAMRAKQNILISGGYGAGKSTLCRALLTALPPSSRVVTLEDPFELWAHRMSDRHPNCIGMEARHANMQGEGEVSLRALFEHAAVRMNPDVIVVGEVRGDEVTVMLNSLAAGNAGGSVSTIHAKSTMDTFARLQSLLAQAPERLNAEAAASLIASAVNLVVHIETDVDPVSGERRRWVDSVREVCGYQGGMVVSNEVVRVDDDGAQDAPAPLSDALKRRLVRAGYDLGALEWAGAYR